MPRKKYIPVQPRTEKMVVDEKMKVLEELCVVDKKNRDEIRAVLFEEIHKYPDTDMDRVVDRVARMLISKKFG